MHCLPLEITFNTYPIVSFCTRLCKFCNWSCIGPLLKDLCRVVRVGARAGLCAMQMNLLPLGELADQLSTQDLWQTPKLVNDQVSEAKVGQGRVSFCMLSQSHIQTHNPCWAKPSCWKPQKPPEIIETVLSSPHPTCTLTLIPRTLVPKVLQGGDPISRLFLGWVCGEGDACA